MSKRITAEMLRHNLSLLNKALNRPTEPYQNSNVTKPNAGHLTLDHTWSGYRIEEILASGGARAPFGEARLKPTEMHLQIMTALATAEMLTQEIEKLEGLRNESDTMPVRDAKKGALAKV